MTNPTIPLDSISRPRTASELRQASSPVSRGPSTQAYSIASGPAVDERTWWQCCEADGAATFFSTPEWSEILAASFSAFRPKPFLFTFGSGARYVVPAIEVARAGGRITALHSMPFGTYGGIVGPVPPSLEESEAILGHLVPATRLQYQTTMFPNPLAEHAWLAPSSAETDHVYAPDLKLGYDGWWQGLDARTRYHIRKAERHGVEIRNVMDAEDFDAFYRLYELSARAWDPVANFGARFFRAVWQLDSPRVRLWTARFHGELVAGVLVFQHNQQVTPFLSATAPGARAFAPTNLLYARLLQACATERRLQFSFLGSGGRPGVERFKRSMGGQRRDFCYLDRRGPLYGLVHNRAAHAARRATRRVLAGSPSAPAEILNAEGLA